MLRFSVFDEQGPADTWPLVGAHLLGPEDVPVAGSIKAERGQIRLSDGKRGRGRKRGKKKRRP